ncbi:hypothetical protein HYV83_03230 [Candidatus Woesearchaeota archaeon]|nr:hypothetical protein [Candidatus Woesearchaeota archaeon]
MGTKKAARKASKMQMAFSKFPKFSKIQAKNGMPFGKSVPSEFKLVGALVLMLAILYVFQLISTPSFLKSQTQAITGLVVSDTAQQEQTTQPQQQTATTSPSSPVTKKETKQAAQTSTAPVQAAPTGPVIKIVEPQKDSTLSPGFTV